MPSQATRQIKTIFGANVRVARDAAGLTQHQLAQQLGVDPQYVSRWERGVVLPSATNAVLLADVLGRDMSWFYVDREDVVA